MRVRGLIAAAVLALSAGAARAAIYVNKTVALYPDPVLGGVTYEVEFNAFPFQTLPDDKTLKVFVGVSSGDVVGFEFAVHRESGIGRWESGVFYTDDWVDDEAICPSADCPGVLSPDKRSLIATVQTADGGQIFVPPYDPSLDGLGYVYDVRSRWTTYIEVLGADPGKPVVFTVKITDVPEPATWALMIAGFGLAGAALRRRRVAALAA